MIHTFSAKNYYSFEGEVSVDFRVDANAPKSDAYCTTKSGARISQVEAIIGPNASGKTTALRALAFINWFIVGSFRYDTSELPIMAFAGGKDAKLPTEFSVVFEMDLGVHEYYVAFNSKRLIKEELIIRSLTNKRTTAKKVFSRTWDDKTKSYRLEDSAFGVSEDYWSNKELGNTSLISAANRFGNSYATQIVSYWQCFETNVELTNERFSAYPYGGYRALMYYQNHKDSRLKAEEDVRRYADLGIDSFGEHGTMKHKFGDDTFELDFENESSGTQYFLAHRRMMDDALDKGGLVVIDELDAYLHPQMFLTLVKKFLDNSVNTGHAQLLLSAHELLILNALDKYQINFASKNNRGATSIRRLDSEKGVRSDDNYLTKYMQGLYGSWPVIS